MIKTKLEHTQALNDTPTALDVVSEYIVALSGRNSEQMNALRSPDFVLDWVHGDAYEDEPLSVEDTKQFWPSWFAGFSEMDYEVTRTIAAETVIVTQWIFTGTHSRPLNPPIFEPGLTPTGRTIRFRGVSIYDISQGFIQRETTYMDLATLMVELGVDV